jgi:hypothetical protein
MIDMLVNELDYVITAIEETSDALERLYFFSGIPAAVHRVFNIEYDPDLVFIHHVLSSTHQGIMQRIDAIRKGDAVVPIVERQLDKLLYLCKELRDALKNNVDTDSIMKKFILLLYSTTGNGYYLTKKGVFEF